MTSADVTITEEKIIEMFEEKRAEEQDSRTTRLLYQMAQQSFQTGELDKMDAFSLLNDLVDLTPTMREWLEDVEAVAQDMG